MRIGILGGAFDPPHKGHLNLALNAFDQLKLDQVILVPYSESPGERFEKPVPIKHRLKMLDLLIGKSTQISVSDIELTRGGKSYTVDTIEEIKLAYEKAHLWLIMGSDSFNNFPDWKLPEKIVSMCRLAVGMRTQQKRNLLEGKMTEEFKEQVDFIDQEPSNVSSRDIRRAIHFNDFLKPDWLTPEVHEYIKKHNLYKYEYSRKS